MPSRSNKTEGKGQSGGHCSELGNKWGVGSDLTQRSNKEGRDKGQRCLGERISRPQKLEMFSVREEGGQSVGSPTNRVDAIPKQ